MGKLLVLVNRFGRYEASNLFLAPISIRYGRLRDDAIDLMLKFRVPQSDDGTLQYRYKLTGRIMVIGFGLWVAAYCSGRI